jgi:DNA-directed RNA polymerase specialized sigma24 family protein
MQMSSIEFGVAYEIGFNRTVRLLSSKGVSHQDATEIAQAAWVRGFERREQLFSPDCVAPWVNSIALNLLKDEFRRPETCWPVQFEVPCSANPLQRAIATELFASCTKWDAQLLKRRYVHGYTMDEIASLMNLEVTSVRVRLHRLRRKLIKRDASLTRVSGAPPAPRRFNRFY